MKHLKALTKDQPKGFLPDCNFKVEFHETTESFLKDSQFDNVKKIEAPLLDPIKGIFMETKTLLHSILTVNEISEERLQEAIYKLNEIEERLSNEYIKINKPGVA